MNLEEKRQYAKSLGIKQAMNMKEETLDARIKAKQDADKGDLEAMGVGAYIDASERTKQEGDSVKIVLDKAGSDFLNGVKFSFERLKARAKEMGFNKLEYINKYRAFACYKNNKLIDHLDIGGF